MPNVKITDLTELTSPATDDKLAIVDKSDTMDSPDGTTKYIQVTNLVTGGVVPDDSVTNAKLANMAQATIKGRAAGAGTGDPTDLSGTQATAILDNVVGDSGSGGTKGLVPAPGAGDAAAGKYLDAGGGFSVPPGTGFSQEQIEDLVGAMVIGGTDIDVTYDDGAGTITIDATGGGGASIAQFLPITSPPALAGWTWVNQGTATAGDFGTGSTGIVLTDVTHSGNSVAILKRAAPGSTPYQITAGILPQGIDRDFCSLGVCFRKSGDGSLQCIGLLRNTTLNLRAYTHSSPTSSGSVVSSINPLADSFAGAPIIYLRIRDNGTNLIFSYSTNGYVFTQLHSMARGSPAPDEVGFFIDSNATTLDISIALISWLVE